MKRIWLFRKIVYVMIVALCLVPLSTSANDDLSWQLDGASALVEEAIELLTVGGFPESRKIVRVIDRTHIEMRPDRVTKVVEMVYYYPTPDSVQNSGIDRVNWDPSSESLTVLAAAAIGKQGNVTQFDPATAEVVDTNSYDLFTDEQQLVLTLPALEEGGLSVLSYRLDISDAKHFLLTDWVGGSVHTMEQSLDVRWQGRPPLWHVEDSRMKCDASENRLVCQASEIPPIQTDVDVNYHDVVPMLTVAAETNWEDIVAEMRGLVDAASLDRSSLQPLVSKFAESDDPFQAVHELVARKIRYVSFSKGEHTHKPHDVSDTLSNRYGDCKDKSTLMFALLDELGFDAYPVLVATQRNAPERLHLPSRGYFDHMVICAQTAAGERCFDPTDAYSSSAETPYYVQGAVRLDLKSGAQPQTLPSDQYRWQFKAHNRLTFTLNGGQQEELQRVFSGPYAAWLREVLGQRDGKEQEDWLTDEYRRTVSGEANPTFTLLRLDDVEAPLTVQAKNEFEPFLDPTEDLNYTDGSYWIKRLLLDQRIENEHYEVVFNGLQTESEITIDLAGIWSLKDLGAEVNYKTEFGEFRRNYTHDGDIITVNTFLEMPRRIVSVDQFKSFNRFADLVVNATTIRLWGKKRQAEG